MSKYYKAEDVIRKRAETLADFSYWEYGNPKNVDEWIEVAEMEFKELPTIDIVRCYDCKHYKEEDVGVGYYQWCELLQREVEIDWYCASGERIEE